MDNVPGLISVIVPVYNAEDFIVPCIENILRQSYKNIEIIVVDDGSTDRTSAIAKQFPVLLIEQENKGVSAARNTGMDAAKGEFIHFMDVDDLINNTFYERLYEAITSSSADVCCSGMVNQQYPHKTLLFSSLNVYTSTHEKLEKTYVGKWGYVWRYLFRSDFLRRHRLRFEEGRVIEDLMFALPAVYFAKKLVVAPGAVYTYVYRKGSQMTDTSGEWGRKRHEDWLYAQASMRVFALQHGFRIPGINTGKIRYWIRKYFRR